MAATNRARRRGRTRRSLATRVAVLGTGAVAVLVGGAAVAHAGMSGPAPYRLAEVTTGSTSQALTAVGTIQPVAGSTLSFPVAGRVASVAVQPGRTVTAGQLLATLDTTSLSAQVASARSGVASARARLDADENAQSTPATTTAASAGTAPHDATGSQPGAAAGPKLGALQKTLLADQRAADTALQQAKAALARATTICAAAGAPAPKPTRPHPAASGSASRAPAPGPTPSGSAPDPTPSGTPSRPPGTGKPTCDTAESQALAWENTTYRDERKVAADEAALDKALTKAAHTTTTHTTTTHTTVVPRAASARSAPSAEQLAADQSAVDAAGAAEQAAQQSLDQATLLSPEAGTVQAVTLTVGDQVSAGSTTETIVLRGHGGEQAIVDIPVTALAGVAPGQHATVVPDGAAKAVTGTVTAIGLLPDSGSTAVAYPVTVTLDGAASLPDGSTATVSLLTGDAATGTLVVPTSALIAQGRGYAVRVDDHGTLSTVPVTIGVQGPVYTQVRGGLRAGQEVVLADVTAPLPTAGANVRGLVGNGGGPASRSR